MANSQTALRKPRAIEKPATAQPRLVSVALVEPKGVVYTKAWVVELLLDLADYRADKNLVDAVAVEPAAGDGAFLGPMIERLVASCRKLGRPLSDCRRSLTAYELDVASADRARALAVKVLAGCGVESSVAEILAGAWVRTVDYLFEASSLEADFVIGTRPMSGSRTFPKKRRRCTAKPIRPCGAALICTLHFLRRRYAS